MSIDWSKFQRNPIPKKDPRTGKEQPTFREQMAKAYAQENAQLNAQKQAQEVLPILKKALADAMVSRKPITVTRTFVTIMDGFQKSEMGGKFTEMQVPIPAGTILTFSHLDTMLNQFIFKSQTGQEFEIYASPVLATGNGAYQQAIPNPGYHGLLYNTSIYEALKGALENES